MTEVKTVVIDDVTFERRERTQWVALDDGMAVGYERMGDYTCSVLDAYVEAMDTYFDAMDQKETLAQQNHDLLAAVERLTEERDAARNEVARLTVESMGMKFINVRDLDGDNHSDSKSIGADVEPDCPKRSDYTISGPWAGPYGTNFYVYYLGEGIGQQSSEEDAEQLIEHHMLQIRDAVSRRDPTSRQAHPVAPGQFSGMSREERKALFVIVENLQTIGCIEPRLAHVIRRILECMTSETKPAPREQRIDASAWFGR